MIKRIKKKIFDRKNRRKYIGELVLPTEIITDLPSEVNVCQIDDQVIWVEIFRLGNEKS